MLRPSKVNFLQIDPHGLASASLGKSQQQVGTLFNQTIPEAGMGGFAVVLLDEVETLAADRKKMSLEANPVDVHRATDAVLASLDLLTQKHRNILLIATTNYRIILTSQRGRPDVAGMSSASHLATTGLVSRSTGTAIATHDITAGLNYWRPA